MKDDAAPRAQPATVRERLEQHRKNPACASCHAQMDPLGFALENFDAIGAWRPSKPASRSMPPARCPTAPTFEGPAGLRQFLLDRREEFVATVTEKLLTYALGRGSSTMTAGRPQDYPRAAAADDYRWSSIISASSRACRFR